MEHTGQRRAMALSRDHRDAIGPAGRKRERKNSMNQKRCLALALAALLCLGLAGCAQGQDAAEASASVQSVAMLMGVSLSGSDQYPGVVEPKATVSVNKDPNKTVAECSVEVGDVVQAGDLLFTYDSDALQLTLSTAELEVQQLENSITSYDNQIADLERERRNAPSADRLDYTLQIQEAELNRSEAEYNLRQKQAELERLRESMDETEVYAEVSGIVQSINEQDDSGTQAYYGGTGSGESGAYITIMETGTYRIKGTATEEAVGSLYQGMEITAISRLDESQTWHGVIESINTSTTEEDSDTYIDYGTNAESSSRYAFYVTLDSSDGLLIGQHVYLRAGGEAEEESGIRLSSGYLVMDGESASVWAANDQDRLELRSVTLGAYDEGMDEYEITDGLALEDYIAYPDDTLTEGMSVVRYDENSFGGAVSGGEGYVDEGSVDEGYVDEGSVDESYVDEDTVAEDTTGDDAGVDVPVADVAAVEG